MIGLVPDPTTIIHHSGGVAVFGEIAGFIALTLFAVATVLAIRVGYRALAVVGKRGTLEEKKVDLQIQDLDHQYTIKKHQHQVQVLALTAGEPPKADAGQDPAEEPAEEVDGKVVSGEVWIKDQGYDSYSELWKHQMEKREADDAKIEPLPTTAERASRGFQPVSKRSR